MNGSLSDIIDGYLDLRWRIDPVEGTQAGRHEFDELLADWSAPAVRGYIAALRSYTMSLEELSAESLADEIDRTAALHSARHDLLVLEREQPFARDPGAHLGHAIAGLFLLLARTPSDPAARATALLRRLEALPAFLERAAEALTRPSRPLLDVARGMLPGGLALVEDALDDPELDLAAYLEPDELRHARDEALTALHGFSDALAAMEERATPAFAIGRALFDEKLHIAHMIPAGADELARYGERLRDETRRELEALAEEIAPGMGWRALLERLRTEGIGRDELLEAYAEAMESSRAFADMEHLVDDPGAPLAIRETPEFLRAITPFAAYLSPGAYDEDQTGTFYVTVPAEGEPWRPPARADVLVTAVHEGVPGHHLQFSIANRLESPARRVLGSPAAIEGWALYTETLMQETGYLESPVERFFQKYLLLWRAYRVLLDVGMHTRGMTVEEAARILRDELGFDEASAMGEARRYAATPTYQSCYAVGRRDILRLREDARAARGDAFDLAEFHRELLSYGALPTALARWGMGLS